MKKLISQLILLLVLAVSVFGQNNQPILLDEFGKLQLDDLMARIDAVLIETQNVPNSKALFLIFGNSIESGNNPLAFGEFLEAYWIHTMKFPADKLIIEQCFSGKTLRIRPWLIRDNIKPDDGCTGSLMPPAKSTLFETIYFYHKEKTIIPLRKSHIEIGVSESSYSEDSLKAVKKFLDISSENKIYIVTYLGTNSHPKYNYKNGKPVDKKIIDKKSIVKKRINNAKKEMLKNGIKSSQIKTIQGGYVDDFGKLEFWFVPKGGENPKPKPTYFPNKNKL